MAMRNFPDFVTAYSAYAADKFVPPVFNTWCALSIVAGCLERKVCLPWSDTFAYFPNIYVLLVSMPGAGKSVALNKAVNLLLEMNQKTSSLNIMPNQATEAKFIELVGNGKPFQIGTKTVFQNAAYYWASEASNSLRNIYGEFIACLTDFYDCPASWKRAVKKEARVLELRNVCVNLLAGCTFDYLGKLVSDENVMGGFASRPIYVVHQNKDVRQQSFQNGGLSDGDAQMRKEYRTALIEDLTAINKMVGNYVAEPAFAEAWQAWWPDSERRRLDFKSEKLQSLLVRANTNVLKVAMLFAASESDELVLQLHHWEKAVGLIEDINAGIPGLFRASKATSSVKSIDRLTQAVIQAVLQQPGITRTRLEAELNSSGGFKVQDVKQVIDALMTTGLLGAGSASSAGVALIMLGNPDDYL